MKPQRPYLLRALYDWIIDSDETPYVLVDATIKDVVVPLEYVEDGQIVLNMGPSAIRDLVLENEFVMFNSRFGGRAFEIVLPMQSVKAIYCKDTGEGMVFPAEDDPVDATTGDGSPAIASVDSQDAGKGHASLKNVGKSKADEKPLSDASETGGSAAGQTNKDDDKPKSDGSPTLRLV